MSLFYSDDMRALLGALVRYTKVAGTTANGHGDSVEGETADDGKTYDLGVRRMFPWGFDSRPPAGTEALIVFNRGGASNGMMVGNGRDGNGPALDNGEVAIFSKASGAYVKIDKDGVITITASSGQKVVVNADSVYLGAEAGAEALVKRSEFNAHTHQVPGTGTTCVNGAAWTGTATATAPSAVTGTVNTKAK